jgi:hypothetical protein
MKVLMLKCVTEVNIIDIGTWVSSNLQVCARRIRNDCVW